MNKEINNENSLKTDIVPVTELFMETTLAKKFEKFGAIMEKVEGNSFEEKLKNLVKPVKNIKITNKEERETANRLKINITTARTTITSAGKKWRDNARVELNKELDFEKALLELFSKEEEELKKKIEEFDNIEKREERRFMLPMRASMLEAINVIISDDEVLDFDDKGFAKFYQEKKAEFDFNEEQKRLAGISKKHDERYRFLIENDLFNYLDDKYQKFGELEDDEFDEIIAKCGENKELAEKKKQADLEKAKEQAKIEEQQRQEKIKQQEKEREEQEIKNKEEKERKSKEELNKNIKIKIWAKENGYNKETDKLVPNGKEIIMWRKISSITIN